jgi:hypothetical protein
MRNPLTTRTTVMMMTTSQHPDPLTELPLLGGVVEVVNSLLTDLGFPLPLAESLELVGLLILLYVLVAQLLRRVLPWLATVLQPVVDRLLDGAMALMLVPELLVTRIRVRTGKPPFGAAYAYGDGIVGLTDGMRAVARVVLSAVPRLNRAPRAVSVILVVLTALIWNHTTCTGDQAGVCVSPAAHWITEMELWTGSLGD